MVISKQIVWIPTTKAMAPHKITNPEHVRWLAESFVNGGWDLSQGALVGYRYAGGVQLLSGTHRRAGAILAGLRRIPVVLWDYHEVLAAWGSDDWKVIMGSGRGVSDDGSSI